MSEVYEGLYRTEYLDAPRRMTDSPQDEGLVRNPPVQRIPATRRSPHDEKRRLPQETAKPNSSSLLEKQTKRRIFPPSDPRLETS